MPKSYFEHGIYEEQVMAAWLQRIALYYFKADIRLTYFESMLDPEGKRVSPYFAYILNAEPCQACQKGECQWHSKEFPALHAFIEPCEKALTIPNHNNNNLRTLMSAESKFSNNRDHFAQLVFSRGCPLVQIERDVFIKPENFLANLSKDYEIPSLMKVVGISKKDPSKKAAGYYWYDHDVDGKPALIRLNKLGILPELRALSFDEPSEKIHLSRDENQKIYTAISKKKGRPIDMEAHEAPHSLTDKILCFPAKIVLLLVYRAIIDINPKVWPEGSPTAKQRLKRLKVLIPSLDLRLCNTGIRAELAQCSDNIFGEKLIAMLGDFLKKSIEKLSVYYLTQHGLTLQDHLKETLCEWIVMERMPDAFAEYLLKEGQLEQKLLAAMNELGINTNRKHDHRIQLQIIKAIHELCHPHMNIEGEEEEPELFQTDCSFHPALLALTDIRRFVFADVSLPCLDVFRKLVDWIQHESEGLALDNELHLKALAQIKRLFHVFSIMKRSEVDGQILEQAGISIDLQRKFESLRVKPDFVSEVIKDLKNIEQDIDQFQKNYHSKELIENFFAFVFSDSSEYVNLLWSSEFQKTIRLENEDLNSLFQVMPKNNQVENIIDENEGEYAVFLSPYQVNRILLHGLVTPPQEWSAQYIGHLNEVLAWIRDGFSQGKNADVLQRSSYPKALLQQIDYLLAWVEDREEKPQKIVALLAPTSIDGDETIDFFYRPYQAFGVLNFKIFNQYFKPNFSKESIKKIKKLIHEKSCIEENDYLVLHPDLLVNVPNGSLWVLTDKMKKMENIGFLLSLIWSKSTEEIAQLDTEEKSALSFLKKIHQRKEWLMAEAWSAPDKTYTTILDFFINCFISKDENIIVMKNESSHSELRTMHSYQMNYLSKLLDQFDPENNFDIIEAIFRATDNLIETHKILNFIFVKYEMNAGFLDKICGLHFFDSETENVLTSSDICKLFLNKLISENNTDISKYHMVLQKLILKNEGPHSYRRYDSDWCDLYEEKDDPILLNCLDALSESVLPESIRSKLLDKNEEGENFFHIASKNGELLCLILDHPLFKERRIELLNQKNKEGNTLFHILAMKAWTGGDSILYDIFKLSVMSLDDLKLSVEQKNKNEKSVIDIAFENNNIKFLMVLFHLADKKFLDDYIKESPVSFTNIMELMMKVSKNWNIEKTFFLINVIECVAKTYNYKKHDLFFEALVNFSQRGNIDIFDFILAEENEISSVKGDELFLVMKGFYQDHECMRNLLLAAGATNEWSKFLWGKVHAECELDNTLSTYDIYRKFENFGIFKERVMSMLTRAFLFNEKEAAIEEIFTKRIDVKHGSEIIQENLFEAAVSNPLGNYLNEMLLIFFEHQPDLLMRLLISEDLSLFSLIVQSECVDLLDVFSENNKGFLKLLCDQDPILSIELLRIAVTEGKLRLLKVLVDNILPLAESTLMYLLKGDAEFTALQIALKNNIDSVLNFILNISVNKRYVNFMTAVFEQVKDSDSLISVTRLLRKTEYSYLPFHIAAKINSINFFSKLYTDDLEFLKEGLLQTDQEGNTIYHVSAKQGWINIFNYIAIDPELRRIEHILLWALNDEGKNFLVVAAEYNQSVFVEAYIALFGAQDGRGVSQFMKQAADGDINYFNSFPYHIDALKVQLRKTDHQGNTILHYAAKEGRTEVIEFIKDHPELKDLYDELLPRLNASRQDFYAVAAKHGHIDLLRVFLENNAVTQEKLASLKVLVEDHLSSSESAFLWPTDDLIEIQKLLILIFANCEMNSHFFDEICNSVEVISHGVREKGRYYLHLNEVQKMERYDTPDVCKLFLDKLISENSENLSLYHMVLHKLVKEMNWSKKDKQILFYCFSSLSRASKNIRDEVLFHRNGEGDNLFHVAAKNSNALSSIVECHDVLTVFKESKSIFELLNQKNNEGEIPFHIAVRDGGYAARDILLAHVINLNELQCIIEQKNNNEKTVIDVAFESNAYLFLTELFSLENYKFLDHYLHKSDEFFTHLIELMINKRTFRKGDVKFLTEVVQHAAKTYSLQPHAIFVEIFTKFLEQGNLEIFGLISKSEKYKEKALDFFSALISFYQDPERMRALIFAAIKLQKKDGYRNAFSIFKTNEVHYMLAQMMLFHKEGMTIEKIFTERHAVKRGDVFPQENLFEFAVAGPQENCLNEMLSIFFEHQPDLLMKLLISEDLSLFRLMVQHRCIDLLNIFSENNTGFLKLLCDQDPILSIELLRVAVTEGKLALLKVLVEDILPPTESTLMQLLEKNEEGLKMLLRIDEFNGVWDFIFKMAVKKGYINFMTGFFEHIDGLNDFIFVARVLQGTEYSYLPFHIAAKLNFTYFFKELYEKNLEFLKESLLLKDQEGNTIFHCAAKGGQVEVVNFIKERPEFKDLYQELELCLNSNKQDFYAVAAEHGHIKFSTMKEMNKWIDLMDASPKNNKDFLKLLCDQDPTLSIRLLSLAVEQGKLVLIKAIFEDILLPTESTLMQLLEVDGEFTALQIAIKNKFDHVLNFIFDISVKENHINFMTAVFEYVIGIDNFIFVAHLLRNTGYSYLPFHIAVKFTWMDFFEQLYADDLGFLIEGLTQRDQEGNTIYHVAAKQGCFGVSNFISTDPELKEIHSDLFWVYNNEGKNLLVVAGEHNQSDFVEDYINGFGRQDDNGLSQFMWQAENGHVHLFDSFPYHIDALKEQLRKTDDQGNTIFHYAAKGGHVEIVNFIKEHHELKDLYHELAPCLNANGQDFYAVAAEHEHIKFSTLKTMNEWIDLLDASPENNKDFLKLLCAQGPTLSIRLLSLAVEQGKLVLIKALFEDILPPTESTLMQLLEVDGEFTALQIAIKNKFDDVLNFIFDISVKENHVNFMRGVFENTYGLDDFIFLARLLRGTEYSYLSFHIAAKFTWIDFFEQLYTDDPEFLKEGLLQRDQEGNTIYHVAAKQGWVSILDSIWNNIDLREIGDAIFWVFNDEDKNFLIVAAEHNQSDFVEGHISKFGRQDENGFSSFMWAAENGRLYFFNSFPYHIEALKEQLRKTDHQGNTIFHYAAKAGRVEVIDFIKNHPALSDLYNELLPRLNADGQDFYAVAAEHGHLRFAKMREINQIKPNNTKNLISIFDQRNPDERNDYYQRKEFN